MEKWSGIDILPNATYHHSANGFLLTHFPRPNRFRVYRSHKNCSFWFMIFAYYTLSHFTWPTNMIINTIITIIVITVKLGKVYFSKAEQKLIIANATKSLIEHSSTLPMLYIHPSKLFQPEAGAILRKTSIPFMAQKMRHQPPTKLNTH